MLYAQSFPFDSTGFNVPTEWLVFFLVFASVFGLITSVGKRQKSPVFGNSAVSSIIAAVFGFFAAGNLQFVLFFERNFGVMVWVFVGLFFLAFLMEIFGVRKAMQDREEAKKHPQKYILIGAVALLLMVTVGFGKIANIDVPVIGTNNAIMILGLLFFVQLILYAMYEKEDIKEDKGQRG